VLVAGIVWTVREGNANEFNGPVIATGFRSPHPVREPSLGDILRLPNRSGPWRVVDWKMASRAESQGNVLVVESVGD
jgi:hypothetical protein